MVTKVLKSILLASALLAGSNILTAGLAGSLMTSAAHAEIIQAAYNPQSWARGEVDDQIMQVISAGYDQGFRQVVADERGAMAYNGGPATFRVHLQRGVEYRFAARCDGDCSDLDLVLKDAAGRELIADRDPDDTPGFTFRARATGDYVIQLELAECSARRSQVGAVVLARY
jgi:hypothetical protein